MTWFCFLHCFSALRNGSLFSSPFQVTLAMYKSLSKLSLTLRKMYRCWCPFFGFGSWGWLWIVWSVSWPHTYLIALFPLMNDCRQNRKHGYVEDGNIFFPQLETCQYLCITYFSFIVFYMQRWLWNFRLVWNYYYLLVIHFSVFTKVWLLMCCSYLWPLQEPKHWLQTCSLWHEIIKVGL
jgi:hypothetical protein